MKINLEMVSAVLSILAIGISVYGIVSDDRNADRDRRVDVYTRAKVSIDSIAFRELCVENGYNDVINSDINDEWMRNKLLEAWDIKSELEIYDESNAELYWTVMSNIYSEGHTFDKENYEKFITNIKKELK